MTRVVFGRDLELPTFEGVGKVNVLLEDECRWCLGAWHRRRLADAVVVAGDLVEGLGLRGSGERQPAGRVGQSAFDESLSVKLQQTRLGAVPAETGHTEAVGVVPGAPAAPVVEETKVGRLRDSVGEGEAALVSDQQFIEEFGHRSHLPVRFRGWRPAGGGSRCTPPVCACWMCPGAGLGSAARQSAEHALNSSGMMSAPDTCREIHAWCRPLAAKDWSQP